MAVIADYQLKFGPINQINFRDLEAHFEMGECQTFENPLQFDPNEPEIVDDFDEPKAPVTASDDDEDDFDDDDS